MKRIVIVADNSLIVEAIRAGLRRSGEFSLVGHADPRRTSAATIIGASPDVVLLDVVGRSQLALELIRALKLEDEQVAVILLSVEMDPEWLDRVFDAGAACAISKATNPAALATLLRETLSGHIFHRFARAAAPNQHQAEAVPNGDLPLTRREFEILQLVAAGSTNGDVARKLWVTEQTVKFHLRNIYRKLDVANRTEASHFAHVNGLLTAEPALAVAS
ncbi:MAG: response regulator transcription factor [Solirubrobacterales bacterium]|nr:response regulator transcription factor [Solirubrobacterales bacterium]